MRERVSDGLDQKEGGWAISEKLKEIPKM